MPAITSSIITPTPPPRRCEAPAGNGFRTSKIRKRTNPATSTGSVSGRGNTEIVMPATSSTTMAPGSFVPSARSASWAAHVPTISTTSSSPVNAGGDQLRSHSTTAVMALATVPGAIGAWPTPPTVAMARASRGRSPLGALADELVSLDLGNAHAGETARREVTPASQIDDTVDLGRLPRGAPLPGERLVLTGTVDEHVDDAADVFGRAIPRDRIGQLLYARGALG